MTIKELKNLINNIDSKYDNEEVLITDNKEYNEYCLGDSIRKITELNIWYTNTFNNGKGGFYLELRTD